MNIDASTIANMFSGAAVLITVLASHNSTRERLARVEAMLQAHLDSEKKK